MKNKTSEMKLYWTRSTANFIRYCRRKDQLEEIATESIQKEEKKL